MPFSARAGFFADVVAGLESNIPAYPTVATESQMLTEFALMGEANTATISTFTSDIDGAITGGFGGIVLPDGNLLVTTWTDANVYLINPSDDSTEVVAKGDSGQTSECTLGLDGNVYIGPRDGTTLYVMDADTHVITRKTSKFPVTVRVGSMETLPDGNIYIFNEGSNGTTNDAYKYEPSTDTMHPTSFTAVEDNSHVFACQALNGDLYLAPYVGTISGNTHVRKYDYSGDSWSSFDVGNYGWGAGTVGTNGKLYFMPTSTANVLVIDPSDDSYTTIAVSNVSGTNAFRRGQLGPDGIIYSADYTNSSSTDWIRIFPGNNTVSTTSLSTLPSTPRTASYAVDPQSNVIYMFGFTDLTTVTKIQTFPDTAIDTDLWVQTFVND